MKKVQLIGAGIGALHLGIRLQYAGFEVSIFEKNAYAGGVVHTVHHNHYRFDATASIMISPHTYDKIFEDCGRNPRDYYTLIPLEESFRVFSKDNLAFSFPTTPSSLFCMIAQAFPNSYNGYLHFLNEIGCRYSAAQQHILNRSFGGPISLASPKLLYQTYRLHTGSSVAHYLGKCIPDSLLRDSLLFQTLFMGYTPYKTPNIYAAIPAVVQLDGLCHIKGGLSQYTQALVQLFMELGGTLHLSAKVDEVLFSANRPVGIRIGGSTYYSDYVAINTDFRYAYTKLLPASIQKQIMSPKRLKNLVTSTGVFILRLVVDQHLPHLGVHNLVLPQDFKHAMDQTFGGTIPDDPPLYIYYPAAVDDTFKDSNGHVSLHIMVRVPHLKSLASSTSPIFDTLKHTCLDHLEQLTGLVSLRTHIVFSQIVTPYDFWRTYHYTDGGAFGIAHTFTQSMALRPQVSFPNIIGLYFLGCNIHPGNGVSIVFESAQLAARSIQLQASQDSVLHHIKDPNS